MKRRIQAAAAALLLALPACTPSSDDDDSNPTGAYPCDHPDLWPESLESTAHPILVHYEEPGDAAMAAEVVALLDSSWVVEFGPLGFLEPVSDGGACGGDARFDVFLWRGNESCYVDIFGDDIPFMVVDPWGPYGGAILDSTLAHELNHASQAAYDWNEPLIIFEMTSTFIEDVVFDEDDEYLLLLGDFQQFPDWSFDSSEAPGDNWFLYGSALYLLYLRDAHFAGDPSFVEDIWELSSNPPGENEPDFEDALDTILQARSSASFFDSVTGFARWRWYTGARDDGQHFEEGALFPPEALVPSMTATTGSAVALSPAPMMLGTAYVEISRVGGTAPIDVSVSATPGVTWVVQAVPGVGAGDGDLLDLSGGPASVALTPGGTRTLVITAVPSGAYDVDERTDTRYPVTLTLGP